MAYKPQARQYLTLHLKGFGVSLAVLLFVTLFSNPPFGAFILAFQNQGQLVESVDQSFAARFMEWVMIIKRIFWNWPLNVLFILTGPIVLAYSLKKSVQAFRNRLAGKAEMALAWTGLFVLGYIALLTVVNFKIYDRYMFVLAPFMALILGVAGNFLMQKTGDWVKRAGLKKALLLAWVAAFVLAGVMNVRGLHADNIPDGAFFRFNDGVDQVTWYVKNRMEKRPVLFTSNTGWYYNFYFYGTPVTKRIWINSVEELRNALAKYPGAPFYMIWRGAENAKCRNILAEAGVAADRVFQAKSQNGAKVEYSILKLKPGKVDID